MSGGEPQGRHAQGRESRARAESTGEQRQMRGHQRRAPAVVVGALIAGGGQGGSALTGQPESKRKERLARVESVRDAWPSARLSFCCASPLPPVGVSIVMERKTVREMAELSSGAGDATVRTDVVLLQVDRTRVSLQLQ